ncbi:conserved domain protein [Parvimonas sp. oral taxon 393 str. F0440]|nr:conserved domain protein [Parvimonas sp. oral taxon 393 str. F0440]
MKTIQFLDYELYQKIYKNKDFITKIIKEEKDLTEKDKQFYEEVESSDFFDLLQLLSHNHSNFKIVKNLKENSIFYDDNIDFKNRNYICNSFSFDNYFTFNNYTKYYIEIKNFLYLIVLAMRIQHFSLMKIKNI